MHVCWVTTCFPRFHGDHSANFLLTLAKGLVKRGVHLTVVAPHSPGSPRRETFEGIDVRRFIYAIPTALECLAYGDGIPYNIRHSRLARIEVPAFAISGAIETVCAIENADLIHAFWTPSSVLGAPAKALKQVPMLLTLLGSDIRSAPRLVNQIALRVADALVCATEEMAHYLRTYRFDKPVFEIKQTNLVDLGRLTDISPLESELSDWCASGTAVVTSVSRLVDFKDPLGFVQAVPHVLKNHPETRFLIVGDGQLHGSIKSLITDLGLGASVRLTGLRNDVGSLLRISTIFVANSPVSNCYSCAILEAMTVGVPCVITDVGDPDGSFRQKDYVRLARPKDPVDLARAINALLDDGSLRRHYSNMGRQFLADHRFGPDFVINETLRIYGLLCRCRI
jgi:glycosyltransferase involved in cell wall biosynthesis